MDPEPRIAGGSPSDGISVTTFLIPAPTLNHSKPPKSTLDSCELSVATVIVKSSRVFSPLTESVASTVNVYSPAVVGVPEISPDVGSRLSPGGKFKISTTAYDIECPTGPVAVIVCEYGVPDTPPCSGEVVEKTGGSGGGGSGSLNVIANSC